MSRVVVLEALRNSRRGQLKYDATWHTDGHLQDIIQITSSPPPLSPELITHSLQKLQLSADQNELKNSFTDHSSPEESDNEENESHRDCKVLDTVGSKSSYNDDLNCALDKNAAKIQVALHLHEVEITREAKDRVEVRKKQHAEFSQQLEQDARQNISLLQQRMELRQRAHWQKINDVNTESEENRERRLLHQQERHRLHLKRLDAKMKAALQQKELAEMEKQKRKQAELKSFLDSLVKVKGQIDEQAARMIEALEACPHQEQLAPKGNEIKAVIKRLQAKSDQVVVNAQGSKPSEEPFHVMTVLIQKLMDINNLSSHAIAEAEKAGLLAAEERKYWQPKLKKKLQKLLLMLLQRVQYRSQVASARVLNESAQPDSLQEYNKLQENLANVRKAFLELKQSKNKELKKYCFDIQKAINTPINAISSQSGPISWTSYAGSSNC
ncbi:putative nucleoporin GLE1 [Apostichopus japonicus]|uniref:GLE1 RNA export mediator n=1 Tax=Stichopus japonicus TaxID=307972 RepID=A0A2G8LIG3_STIJA|nr:putative nucleoporin GLE1 [Apostichopus japonicus]